MSEEKDFTWEDLQLDDRIVKEIHTAGFKAPTPIQAKAIPAAIGGRDIVASARTGSGKTAGFSLPLIQRLIGRRGTYGLILCPTREIALQTTRTIEQFGGPVGITCVSLIGGVPYVLDIKALEQGCHILIGTPGRICDHLDRGNLWLEYIEMLVLDEADRMLDMGFAKELNRIIGELPKKRQTLLFSATIPQTIERLAKDILEDPMRISIGTSSRVSQSVEHELLWLKEESKRKYLMRLIRDEEGSVIVFCRTKDGAAKLYRSIHAAGIHESTYISSNRRQSDREDALRGFQKGEFRVLVATDVAGRGIHVDDVSLVINYDFPREPEDYIHRIGRTGRKDASGFATSFVTSRDGSGVRRLEGMLKKSIPSSEMSEIDRPGGGGSRRGGDARSSSGRTGRSGARSSSRSDSQSRSDDRGRSTRESSRSSSDRGRSSERARPSRDSSRSTSGRGRSSERARSSRESSRSTSDRGRSSEQARSSRESSRSTSDRGRSSERGRSSKESSRSTSDRGRSSERGRSSRERSRSTSSRQSDRPNRRNQAEESPKRGRGRAQTEASRDSERKPRSTQSAQRSGRSDRAQEARDRQAARRQGRDSSDAKPTRSRSTSRGRTRKDEDTPRDSRRRTSSRSEPQKRNSRTSDSKRRTPAKRDEPKRSRQSKSSRSQSSRSQSSKREPKKKLELDENFFTSEAPKSSGRKFPWEPGYVPEEDETKKKRKPKRRRN